MADPNDPIQTFVRRQRFRHRLWTTLQDVLGHAFWAALVVLAADLIWPSLATTALWAAAGYLVLILAWRLLRPGLALVDLDRVLALQDRLLTAVARHRDGETHPTPMAEWLERDLAGELQVLSPERRRRPWARAAVRAAVLLPLVLLAVWLGPLGFWQQVGQAGTSGPQGIEPGTQPGSKPASKPSSKPGGQHLDQGQAPDPPVHPPKPLPAKPLIPELPVQDEFVVPTFVRDGPSRRVRAPVADVEVDPPPTRPGAKPRKPKQPRGDPGPPSREQEFQKAAERALGARHVPAAERPFVERYFRELTKAKRSLTGDKR